MGASQPFSNGARPWPGKVSQHLHDSLYCFLAEPERIVDGDTIDFMVDVGFSIYPKVRVRLLSIDAPEIYGVKKESEEYQRGQEAVEYVEKWLDEHSNDAGQVAIRTYKGNERGKYGRYLVEIIDPLSDEGAERVLNEAMVDDGVAEPYEG